MVKEANAPIPAQKTNKTISKIDINKLISKAQSYYGDKEKNRALQMSTGNSISRPNKDSDFVCWKGSHWETLTGVRGIPFGRVVQIAGRPDSGKSSHAMAFMKAAQDQNVLVILWDAENKFSAHRFDHYFHGVSDQLLITTSKMILEGGDNVEKLISAAKEQDPFCKILIVWDSVGGTLAANEGEDSLTNSKQMAAASKENGAVLRGWIRLMEKYKNKETNEENIAVLLINQVYANIGSVGQKESGGQKIEFYSSIILQLTRKEDLTKIKDGMKIKTGIVSRAKVKKNHLFEGEYSIAELDLVVSAGGIDLLSKKKIKGSVGKTSWEDPGNGELEEVDE